MSKSFAITNGDLNIGTGRSYVTVSGKDKLMQDLRLWVLEQIGIDSATPSYGSPLDGGIIDGEAFDSFIGQNATVDNLNQIRIAVLNLLQQYQSMQYSKMQDEATIYNGANTLEEDEVVDEIVGVTATQVGTTILVRALVHTLAGSTVQITLPITPAVA